MAPPRVEQLHRRDYQALARTRKREARCLFQAEEYPGAYYLAGYAAECALKACIAKRLPGSRFPPRKGNKDLYIHDLTKLIALATLDLTGAGVPLQQNWAIVKDWNAEARYLVPEKTRKDARDLYRALTGRAHGVLWWIQRHW